MARARIALCIATAAVGLGGCAAENRLGLAVRLEQTPYTFRGEKLEIWSAVPDPSGGGLPVLVFLEGDGGACQPFSEALWHRFLVRYTGRFVLVRPRTLINTLCDTDTRAWEHLDFLHRVDELEAITAAVRYAHPDGPLVLLGHSAGAHVARLYAERHSGQVAGLIDLSGGYDELAGVFADIGERDPERAKELSAFVSEVRAMRPEQSIWQRNAGFWQQMLSSGVRPLWLSYRAPCLVLHGTEDETSVPWAGVKRDGGEVAKAGGSCGLQALSGRGHDTLVPETFERVDAWLEEHW